MISIFIKFIIIFIFLVYSLSRTKQSPYPISLSFFLNIIDHLLLNFSNLDDKYQIRFYLNNFEIYIVFSFYKILNLFNLNHFIQLMIKFI
jgi:hypothetical protein